MIAPTRVAARSACAHSPRGTRRRPSKFAKRVMAAAASGRLAATAARHGAAAAALHALLDVVPDG
eukprot:701029-Prymnesium_polylepis.1